MILVKEDCVLEDETGTAEIHIWHKTHQQDQKWDNIWIQKPERQRKHQAATPKITFKEAPKQLKSVQGPTLLENPEKEVKVVMFKFLNNLSVFVACQACKKKITESSHRDTLNAGIEEYSSMKASAREICPSQSSTDEIKSLLSVSPEVSLMSDFESIEDLLMDLEDISTIYITYDVDKNSTTEVTSVSHGLAQWYYETFNEWAFLAWNY